MPSAAEQQEAGFTGVDEVLMNLPTDKALRQAEIVALRVLHTSINRLDANISELRTGMADIRERLAMVDGQRLETRIDRIEERHQKEIDDIKEKITSGQKELSDRVDTGDLAFARFSGMVAPLAIIGSAIASTAVGIIINLALQGHP